MRNNMWCGLLALFCGSEIAPPENREIPVLTPFSQNACVDSATCARSSEHANSESAKVEETTTFHDSREVGRHPWRPLRSLFYEGSHRWIRNSPPIVGSSVLAAPSGIGGVHAADALSPGAPLACSSVAGNACAPAPAAARSAAPEGQAEAGCAIEARVWFRPLQRWRDRRAR